MGFIREKRGHYERLTSMYSAVDRLVKQVMTTEPYRSARRVFWIADNCSSHRGEKAVGSTEHVAQDLRPVGA
jgi:hypothetical protein